MNTEINSDDNDVDNQPMTIGKHAGFTPNVIGAMHPVYLIKLHQQHPEVCSAKLIAFCKWLVGWPTEH